MQITTLLAQAKDDDQKRENGSDKAHKGVYSRALLYFLSLVYPLSQLCLSNRDKWQRESGEPQIR